MDHEQTIKDLEDTRRLLAAGWTRGADARTANGLAVGAGSARATCFCLRGALRLATREYDVKFTDAFHFIAMATGIKGLYPTAALESLICWNDAKDRTARDVLKAVDLALLLAREDARLSQQKRAA